MVVKRSRKIPLILLIPIVMLVFVILAGIYRFSIPDERILAKMAHHQVEYDPVIEQVLGLKVSKPWTLTVPDMNALAFLDQFDPTQAMVFGRYDAGSWKGQVALPTGFLHPWPEQPDYYVAPIIVTTPGSGTFYYLALFKYDAGPDRVVMTDSVLLGDRVVLDELMFEGTTLIARFLVHGDNQAMAETPNFMQTWTLLKSGHRLKIMP